MKSMKPGGGGRFAALVAGGKSPALAAYIGREKYGAAKMAKFSSAGRHREAVQDKHQSMHDGSHRIENTHHHGPHSTPSKHGRWAH